MTALAGSSDLVSLPQGGPTGSADASFTQGLIFPPSFLPSLQSLSLYASPVSLFHSDIFDVF